jgi:hypothetical protein
VVALLSPIAGDHVYVVAPLAFKFVEVPEQIVVFAAFAEILGMGCTVTLAVEVQPFSVPETVYKVELEGVATGFAMDALLSPIDGDQLYVEAPFACKVTPEHMVTLFWLMLTLGYGLTVTVTFFELVQPLRVPVTV